MSIPVKLEAFEGPLDLLLHLIDKNKVNIHDIPIVEITEQYMEYIRGMETKDLDIMSEFLVMAATLIKIKSQMLLPKDETKEEEEEDPRKELVERLLEYKMFKYISLELKDRELDAGKVLYKKPTIPEEISEYEEEVDTASLLQGLTLAKLHRIFESVIKRQTDKIDPIRSKFGRIEKEEVTLSDKIEAIQQFGLLHKTFSFRKLLMAQCGKMEVIVTFLGVLELMKIGQVIVNQDSLFDDITITFVGDEIKDMEEDLILI
ncbi:segregation and condensation protein A [Anaerocolumna cellulosilytica]|uniref:Segregation and condensation protein A n=1 Tax=Anaerocolumna cellulosilytica TaxID=433286 RepID=A0A6S6R5U0_9FIRM|nr:segregation/condensation protein A [Anaerocolumna cellulosilytica]MBB5193974.1 segregation and condensation protein A [Anaerocolumna cellulosilytica]BCJ94812.1 segregation and condensation protein A [Anaerocolumna cellulosilytica]